MRYTTAADKYTLPDLTTLGRKKKAYRQRSLFDHFLPSLPSSAKVLEIGPGRGEFARECQKRRLDYLAIEPSQKLRQHLVHMGIPALDQTVPPIQLDSTQFDLVHTNDVVEHLGSYTEVMQFFEESFRVLRPGGYISVIAPNYRTIKHLFFEYAYDHSYITTRNRLNNMLTDCGFTIIRSKCFFLWISPWLNRIDRILAHIVVPVATNSIVEYLITAITSEEFLFRVHKNVFDHVAVLGRKPPE